MHFSKILSTLSIAAAAMAAPAPAHANEPAVEAVEKRDGQLSKRGCIWSADPGANLSACDVCHTSSWEGCPMMDPREEAACYAGNALYCQLFCC